jgi:hypothetical protein
VRWHRHSIAPPVAALPDDARKRLEAIESLEESNNALTDALAVMTNQRDVAHAKIDAAVAALT